MKGEGDMRKFSKFMALLLLIGLFLFPIHATSDVDSCTLDDPDCLEEYRKAVTKNDFAIQGMVSFDKAEMLEEMGEEYVVYFSSSAEVPNSIEVDMFNLGESFIGLLFVGIISLFEQLGLFISWIVMVIYNFASSNVVSLIIRNVGEVLNQTIFDWKNPAGVGVSLIILVTLVTILKMLLQNFKLYSKSRKNIFQDVMGIVLNAFLIYFIALSGTGIVYQFEEGLTDSIGDMIQIEYDENSSSSVAVQTKDLIFDLMQMQPYMLRNFGTMNVEDLEGGIGRVHNLLDGTTSVKEEVNSYDNAYIIQDSPTAVQNLFFEFLIIIQRILLTIIIASLTILFLAFQFVKELLLLMAVLNIVKLLFNPRWSIFDWFVARVLWAILAVLVSVGFTVILYALFKAIAYVTSINVLFLIVFDAVVVYLIYLVKNNWQLIAEKFMREIKTYSNLYTGTEGCMEIAGTLKQLYFENPADLFGLSGNSQDSSDDTYYNTSTVSPLHEQDDLADIVEDKPSTADIVASSLYDTIRPNEVESEKKVVERTTPISTLRSRIGKYTQPRSNTQCEQRVESAITNSNENVRETQNVETACDKNNIKEQREPRKVSLQERIQGRQEAINANGVEQDAEVVKGDSQTISGNLEPSEIVEEEEPLQAEETVSIDESIQDREKETIIASQESLATQEVDIESTVEEIAEPSVDSNVVQTEKAEEIQNAPAPVNNSTNEIQDKKIEKVKEVEEDKASNIIPMSDDEMLQILEEEDVDLEFLGDKEDEEWYD